MKDLRIRWFALVRGPTDSGLLIPVPDKPPGGSKGGSLLEGNGNGGSISITISGISVSMPLGGGADPGA